MYIFNTLVIFILYLLVRGREISGENREQLGIMGSRFAQKRSKQKKTYFCPITLLFGGGGKFRPPCGPPHDRPKIVNSLIRFYTNRPCFWSPSRNLIFRAFRAPPPGTDFRSRLSNHIALFGGGRGWFLFCFSFVLALLYRCISFSFALVLR